MVQHAVRALARPTRLTVIGLLAASLLGCESPLSPRELRALAAAEARWADRGFRDYSVDVHQSCGECPGLLALSVRIEVVAGGVTRVTNLGSGTDLPPEQHSWYPTVEQVFGLIRDSARDPSITHLDVEFDRVLGFPTSVGWRSRWIDGDGALHLRNVAPLP